MYRDTYCIVSVPAIRSPTDQWSRVTGQRSLVRGHWSESRVSGQRSVIKGQGTDQGSRVKDQGSRVTGQVQESYVRGQWTRVMIRSHWSGVTGQGSLVNSQSLVRVTGQSQGSLVKVH